MTLASPENILNVTELCRIAGVSRSGYYNWLKNGQKTSQKEYQDQADFALIQEAYAFRGYDKGVMGICMGFSVRYEKQIPIEEWQKPCRQIL